MPNVGSTSKTVLMTGASGFLGSFVIEELVRDDACQVVALVRPMAGRTVEQRLESLWWGRDALVNALRVGRVRALPGDIAQERLGLTNEDYDALAASVTHVVHAAAEVGVNQTAERFAQVNVGGTRHALEFARACVAAGPGSRRTEFGRFIHISTAYVAGTMEGAIPEDFLMPTGFNSLYEQSKHEAEQLVRAAASDVPFAIVRPSQIVGDSKTGFISTFNTLYYPLKLYLKGKLRVVPMSSKLKVNMVPVDYVARMAVAALEDPAAENAILHAVTPSDEQPTVGELIDAVRLWAHEVLHVDLPNPLFVPLPLVAAAGRKRNMRVEESVKSKSFARNMLALAPYFSEKRSYGTDHAHEVLPDGVPAWRTYLPNLLRYATNAGFMNHTGRTVFEQMLVRMRSRRAPLDYFDISPEGMTRRSSTDLADQMERAARALLALGVRPGDRVALIGVNSTRYLVADAAIGLTGAVSVPLYYTTPPNEAAALVKRSGARIVFVGTEKLAAVLPPLLGDELVISILPDAPSAAAVDVPAVGSDAQTCDLMPWERFLSSADVQDAASLELPYVSPGSLATIRYTSGTTGEPKGVTFDQYQLRWMGSTMPAVLDWATRNRKLRYLSFLPMSHVVEGVLVAYAPYYILSDIEFYYLSDFPSLVPTLPKVQPTLLFSVPRFYEKAWDQFTANPAGAYFARLEDGVLKRLLAPVMKRVLLKKAGLGSCRQLIVGSAPMSVELMQAYRSLGIEVHNAYGVTEAPLICINRLGENDMGSVGTPLPETEIRVTDEGYVFVRGPQVTRRYDGFAEGALDAEGWFDTGDLGAASERGNLMLRGRRKELLITSYGKNVSPQKVEVLLKNVPGVGEALLVGEGRPFCTALLWPKEDAPEGFDHALLDAGVRAMNERLSHPEQVKRWAVLKAAPTISSGELTPNLKLRRGRALEARADAVAALYGEWPAEVPGSIHCGQA